ITLACINFITLSTARSGIRAKEVGIRKVSGSKKMHLISQFLTESVLLSLIALVFAVLMVVIFFRPFNSLLEIQKSSGIVFITIALLVVAFVVGVVAGSYPAFVLSAFKPVNVLKGQLSEKIKGGVIRNSLVVFQFIISIILIVSSIVVYKQFVYMQNKDLGFDKENIIILKNAWALFWQDRENMSIESREHRAISFRQEILKQSNVINATYTGNVPGVYRITESGAGYQWDFRFRLEGEPSDVSNGMPYTYIDHAYLDVFGLEMAAGEYFREYPLSQAETAIINETAVNKFGLNDPVGKYLYIKKPKYITNREGEQERVMVEFPTLITGVFKDFHNRELKQGIKETLYFPIPEGRTEQFLAIRFLPGNISENIAFLKNTWEKFGMERPFNYSFFDQEFENLYNKEKRLAHIFTFFTLLAIFIACLGIFGLAAFTAEQRTKEIGIRKAMGASIQNIVEILSRIYMKLILVAVLFACPIGFILMNKWLLNFPFRTNVGVIVFVLTILVTLIIVISSVSYHSIKAAMTDPARTLKYE
ncbi:MAG: FtsX-like permease family protein, partial [Draconibacterium sp.]|nr:FtsX-like permease family protein [Draconibacterium sp.]